MILIRDVKKMRRFIAREKERGSTISFVPTMGAIHKGHLSLVKRAKKKGGMVVVSIFVNPAQFGQGEDYKRYPRTFGRDRKLLEENGVNVLFNPSVKQMYPAGYSTYVEEERLSKTMCGIFRPGHFRGVATIVLKLFNIIQPDTAVFGQKDYQQALIIKKMVRDLNMDVKIDTVPIVRERDGLAVSSRNQYLSSAERKRAVILYRSLLRNKPPRGVKLDYFAKVNKDTLKPVKKVKKGTLIAAAGWVGKTRLIDNIIV